jgi:ribonucleoside-diphosphate reductase alpha chain
MARVIRNHRRAAFNVPEENYESLSIKPKGLLGTWIPQDLVQVARQSWDQAMELGTKHGYRNAQVTVLAPTGTIGLLMDCDTTGIEPDFALVKFKKLAGGGYFKLVNGALKTALGNLGYTKEQILDIERYAVGWQQITSETPGINRDDLLDNGWIEAEINSLEQKLLGAFDPSYVLDLPRLKKDFSADRVATFVEALSGALTVEGAPHIRPDHLPIFDCANKCGKKGTRYIAPEGHLRMMAAAQPFLSGAISKTVNLPPEYTIDQVASIYETSWKLMLKAVAIYREGSKMSQAIATNLSLLEGADILLDDGASSSEKSEAVAQAAAHHVVRIYRRKMPDRRAGYTQSATIGGTKLYLRTGEYDDGTLGEIFLDLHKEGAGFRAVLNCFAIAISMGLQYGVPLEEYCEAFLFTKFEPQGMVLGSDTVKFTTSLIDFVFRELAISYLGRYELANIPEEEFVNLIGRKPESQAQVFQAQYTKMTPLFPESNSEQPLLQVPNPAPAHPASNAYRAAREKGFTGDPCPECGHLTLVRNGACLKCQTCGASTGCS